jgi:hypothetical protein
MIILSPKKIAGTLLGAATFIALVNVVSDLYAQFSGGESLRFSRLFSFDDKITIPTWYSSSLMLLCALLCGAIACDSRAKSDRQSGYWAFFSLVFLLFSLDEVTALHLRLDFISRYMFQLGGFRYGLYLLLVAAIAATVWICRKFFAQLPSQTRWQLGAGSFFYIAAIVVDQLDKRIWRGQDLYTVAHAPGLFTAVDELLELVGLVVFIYALLTYIGKSIKELQIRIQA